MRMLKTQLAWLVKGGAATNASLAAYGADLRALQDKVARIDAETHALRAERDHVATELARTQTELDVLRSGLRAAVDDLGDRIGTIAERVG